MMMRKYLLVSLAILSGGAFVGPTASAATATKPPIISDRDAVHFLTPAQLDQWNTDVQQISDGNEQITEGKRLTSAKSDPLAAIKVDVTAEHQKGTAEIKEGQATVKLATIDQDKLRVIAAAKRDAIKSGAAATDAAMLTVVTAQWPDVFASMTEKVLSSLWDQNYKKIYLADVYSFEEPNYVAKPGLTDQIRQQLVTLDKGKDTFSAAHDWSFKLGQENGKLILSYPDRAYVQQGNTKAAVILGEVLYESHDGYAAVDLRAVDLDTMNIVANQIMMLSVDPSLGKLLGLASYKAMSQRLLPTADSKLTGPVTAVTVNLQDPNDVFAEAKKATYAFRVGTLGHHDTLENRIGILLLKSYLRDQQADLNTSDQDFLSMVLAPQNPGDLSASPANVGGEWQIPDISDLGPSMELDTLKLHLLDNNSDHDVGKIMIDRNLPRLTDPSAEDLRAGGYTASP
jgi:hypothetical protein